jgi:hypothetical protein
MGHTGESYQISQWYPKPAVYDNTGWHQMPYLDQGEFYSEYGNFDVSITLPSNYIIGSTGKLHNQDESRWLDNLAADTSWMRIPDYLDETFPASSTTMKTLRYTENNVHDFAWFADKRFHVMKGNIKLPESGRNVTTWSMFLNKESYLWKRSITYINNAIWYFSKWNGDYPYNSYTAVQSSLNSGDGMEYPGLTVVSHADDSYLLEDVLAHEICHSWFYSAIGSDERRFPFMDESITSANESRYMAVRRPGEKMWELTLKNRKLAEFFHAENIPAQRIEELGWVIPSRLNLEQSINLPASEYTYDNYGTIIYSKAAQGFNFLRFYLGDSLYDSIMHDYYANWKNKHPMPDDLRKAFESHTDKNLAWFFDDFLGSTKRLDYKVIRYRNGRVLIKNKGEMNAPLLVSEHKGDTLLTEKWENGFAGRKWIHVIPGDNSEIRIDPDHKMTELYRLNNNIRTSGSFRKRDPFQCQLLYTIEDPDKRYLIYLPAFNWNQTDGFMAGAVLQSGGIIPKPFEYFLIPFISFKNERITGYGKITLNSIPYNSFIRLVSYSIEGEQFGAPGIQNYHRVKGGLDLLLTPINIANAIEQKISAYYISASDLKEIESITPAKMLSYLQVGYQLKKKSAVNPYNLAISFEAGKSYQKTSVELNYKYSYNGKKNGLETRFFAGTMLQNDPADPFYSFSASGRSGLEQYLYEGVYPDRFNSFPNTFLTRQMALTEGGLASEINDSLGYSRWLFSISLASTLPGRTAIVPVKPFINILLNDHGVGTTNPTMFFEAGLKAGIWNIFEVYFPFIVSKNIDSITGSFSERIRFIFRLDKLNVFNAKSRSAN